MAVLCFICWYYPMGLYRNAEWTNAVHLRSFLLVLLIWQFFLFTSTFAHMIIAGLPNPDIAASIMNLIFVLMFVFCGILAGPEDLPRFWIFMYRISPFTYIVEGFLGASLADAPVECTDVETLRFAPPTGTDCREYMYKYMSMAGGHLINASSDSIRQCEYCPLSSTNYFLENFNMKFDNSWRNFGLLWAYIAFNITATVVFYWLARVPKKRRVQM